MIKISSIIFFFVVITVIIVIITTHRSGYGMITKQIEVTIQKAHKPEYDATFVMSATTPDRVNDTISKDAYSASVGKSLIALFAHDHEKIVGHWENLRVEGQKLLGDLKVASTNLGQMVKGLIDSNVPLGASIGFRGKGAPNKKGGIHFDSLELLECSVVSVPAHASAMMLAKKFDLESLIDPIAPTGAGVEEEPIASTVKSAEKSTPKLETKKMNLQEKLAMFAKQIDEAQSGIAAITKAAEEDQRNMSDEELAKIDELSAVAETAEKQKAGYEKAEKAAAQRAKPVIATSSISAPAIVKNYGQNEDPARLYAKSAVAQVYASARRCDPVAMAKEIYPHDDRVEAVIKSSTGAANSQNAGWVQELMTAASNSLVESLKPVSVFGALAGMGSSIPFNGAYKHNFLSRNTTVPALNGGHAWVAENGVIPVIQGAYTSRPVERNKIAGIVQVTKEALRYSSIDLENELMNFLRDDLAAKIDGALLSNVAAVAGVSSAGLLNGATTAAGATGGGQAAADTDLSAMFQSFAAMNYNGSLALLMNPAQRYGLARITNASGAYVFKDEVNMGMINGANIIVSTNVPVGTVILVGASDFCTAYDAAEIMVDDVATVTMANADGIAPTQALDAAGAIAAPAGSVGPGRGIHVGGAGTTGAGTAGYTAVSAYQQWLVNIRQVLPIGWTTRRPGVVVTRTGVTF